MHKCLPFSNESLYFSIQFILTESFAKIHCSRTMPCFSDNSYPSYKMSAISMIKKQTAQTYRLKAYNKQLSDMFQKRTLYLLAR
jgi:hypothetical protein